MQASDIDAMHAVEASHWWFWGKRQLMRRLFADRLRRGGLRILDIGCGAGANALELSAWGDVTAADRSIDALAWVRSRGVLRAVAADGTALPFPDASFDLVTAYDIMEHVEDDAAFLREAARVLAPGGTLALHVPAWPSLWSAHDVVLEHKRRYTRHALTALLRANHDLAIERVGWTNFSIFLPTVAVRWVRRLLGREGDGADLGVVPAPVNAVLRAVYRVEGIVAATTGLPVGVSLAAIVRKRQP